MTSLLWLLLLMANLHELSGAGFSGADGDLITTANTGFANVDFGGPAIGRFNSSLPIPPWSVAAKWIKFAGGATGQRFYVHDFFGSPSDLVSANIASGVEEEITIRFERSVAFVQGTTPAHNTDFYLFSYADEILLTARVTNINGVSGIQLFVQHVADVVSPVAKGYYSHNEASSSTNRPLAHLRFGVPHRIKFRIKKAVAGWAKFLVDGRKISQITGDFSGTTALPGLYFGWMQGTVPVGMDAYVTGPFKINSPSVETNISNYANVGASNDLVKAFPIGFELGITDRATARQEGCLWLGTGTGTAVVTANGGATARSRVVITGVNGNVYTLTTSEDVYNGTSDPSPYNADGYTILCFLEFYVPSSGKVDFLIRNAADNATLATITFDEAGRILNNGTQVRDSHNVPGTYDKGAFHSAWIMLHSSGTCSLGVSHLSMVATRLPGPGVATPVTSDWLRSFPLETLAGWTSTTAIGPLKQVATFAGSSNIELGGVIDVRHLGLPLPDSFCSGTDINSALSNELPGAASWAIHANCSSDNCTLPGGWNPGYFGLSTPDLICGPMIGRRGSRFSEFADLCIDTGNLNDLHACHFVMSNGVYNDQGLGPVNTTAFIADLRGFRTYLYSRKCLLHLANCGVIDAGAPGNATHQPEIYPIINAGEADIAGQNGMYFSPVFNTAGTVPAITRGDTVHDDNAGFLLEWQRFGSTFVDSSATSPTGGSPGGAASSGGPAFLAGTSALLLLNS